jgi:hypothetical protein
MSKKIKVSVVKESIAVKEFLHLFYEVWLRMLVLLWVGWRLFPACCMFLG